LGISHSMIVIFKEDTGYPFKERYVNFKGHLLSVNNIYSILMPEQIIDVKQGRYIFMNLDPEPTVKRYVSPETMSALRRCGYCSISCVLYGTGIASILTFAFYIYIEPHLH